MSLEVFGGDGRRRKVCRIHMRNIVLSLLRFLAIALLGFALAGCGPRTKLSDSCFGVYHNKTNGYDSTITIVDAASIKIEIRTPLGYADKSGTYTVYEDKMTVTWTAFGATNLVAEIPSKPQTQEMEIGSKSYGGTSWYEIRVGGTDYIKKID